MCISTARACCEHAIASGITTMLGGSLGPITVGIDSGGPFNTGKMLQAAEAWPLNFGFLGRGNSHRPASLIEQLETGCLGLKIHEDWGAMPATIDACLAVADELDFQVQLHTDTLNESGFVEDTLAAIGGPHHPHVPHRGCRRRPCARHHPGRRAWRTACRRRRTRPIPTRSTPSTNTST